MLEKLYEQLKDEPNIRFDYKNYELALTRYIEDGVGSTLYYLFQERNGELYAYKRLTTYEDTTLTGYGKVTKETPWLKMCTIEVAIQFVKIDNLDMHEKQKFAIFDRQQNQVREGEYDSKWRRLGSDWKISKRG